MDNVVKSEQLSAEAHFAWNLILATYPGTATAMRIAAFKVAFERVYGIPFEHCAKARWRRDYDRGMEELQQVHLIEVTRDGMGGWEVTAVYPDRLQPGSGILLEQ